MLLLCRALTSCHALVFNIQVAAVLEYATHNNVEPFLEPVLDLCHAIVQVRERPRGRAMTYVHILPHYRRLLSRLLASKFCLDFGFTPVPKAAVCAYFHANVCVCVCVCVCALLKCHTQETRTL